MYAKYTIIQSAVIISRLQKLPTKRTTPPRELRLVGNFFFCAYGKCVIIVRRVVISLVSFYFSQVTFCYLAISVNMSRVASSASVSSCSFVLPFSSDCFNKMKVSSIFFEMSDSLKRLSKNSTSFLSFM